MYAKITKFRDIYLKPIKKSSDGVRNNRTIRVLKGCGTDLRGYGSKEPKKRGDKVVVCAPAHVLERRFGTVIKIGLRGVLVMFDWYGKTLNCWFYHDELKIKEKGVKNGKKKG